MLYIKRSLFFFYCAFLSVFVFSQPVAPVQDAEELLFLEIPEVTLPSRIPQPITESPSTVTVILREDLDRLGITNIAEALRLVSGISVFRLNPSEVNITVREHEGLNPRRLLVLVDGVSVYYDLFGITLWESLHVNFMDIERIEVIKGPGSAVYGANAFYGVINIITKKPSKTFVNNFSAEAGEHGKIISGYTGSGTSGRLAYSASASTDRQDGLEEEIKGRKKNSLGRVYLQYDLKDSRTLNMDVAVNDYLGKLTTTSFDAEVEGQKANIKLNYASEQMNLQYYYNQIDGSLNTQFIENEFFEGIHDVEAYSTVDHGSGKFLYGFETKYSVLDADLIDGKRSVGLASVFVEEMYSINDQIDATIGLRFDDYTLTGSSVSPRMALVYNPWEGHYFRASAGNAYRIPTFIEAYSDMGAVGIFGNDDLDPENVWLYELGYTNVVSKRMKFSVTAYRSAASDIIDFIAEPGTLVETTYNRSKINTSGVEFDGEYLISVNTKLFANLSFMHYDKDSNEYILTEIEEDYAQGKSGVYSSYKKLYWSLYGNTINSLHFIEGESDSYVCLNGMLGYRFTPEARACVKVQNMLDDGYREFPYPYGQENERLVSILASVDL